MKVICIKAGPIHLHNGGISYGTGLVKDKIYEYTDLQTHWNGKKCYNIKGLGLKQTVRFKEIDTDLVDELLESIQDEELVNCC
jgi:hypothetical protein